MRKMFSIGLLMLFALNFVPAETPIKIYVTYGQSPTAIKEYISAEDIRGANLAAAKINAEGGILGRQLEIIDGKAGSLTQVKEKALEQIEADEITAVVGANTSGMTMIVAPMFQEAGIPIVSPIATHPDVTAIGPYVFRACFTDHFQGEIMAKFAINDLNATSAIILKKTVSNFSLSLSEYFRQAFSEHGTVLWEGDYLPEDADFFTLLERVRYLNPDVVFLPGHGGDSGLIIKQAHVMEIKAVFLGGDGWGKGALGVAGAEAAEGNYFVNHWHPDVVAAKSQDFVHRYQEEYGESLIASSAALAFDAVHMVADAIRRADSCDRDAVRVALTETKGFEGVTGTITLDQQGDPLGKDGVIMMYKDGKIIYVKSLAP